MTRVRSNFNSAGLEEMALSRSHLDKGTLADRVYESLRGDILANRLAPGTPLQEEALGNAIGVSRAPIREALRRLAAEGLVSVTPRRGAIVSSLSREDFLNAYQVREALEVLAIQLAVPRLKPDDLSEMEGLHREMLRAAAAGEEESFFTANSNFHSLFVDRSGNVLLQEVYYPLIDQMRRYRMRSMTLRGGMVRSCEEHRAILDAVQRGQVEEATRLLREHIQIPQRILSSSDNEGELELAASNELAI